MKLERAPSLFVASEFQSVMYSTDSWSDNSDEDHTFTTQHRPPLLDRESRSRRGITALGEVSTFPGNALYRPRKESLLIGFRFHRAELGVYPPYKRCELSALTSTTVLFT